MRTQSARILQLTFVLMCVLLLTHQHAQSQSVDTTTSHPHWAPALQFHLFGGFALYYISDCNAESYFRVGADLSLGHSNTSEDREYLYSQWYTSGADTTSYSVRETGQPERKSSSYWISLSGVFGITALQYAHTTLYVGVGPTVLYSRSKYSDTYLTHRYETSSTRTYTSHSESTLWTWGIGSVALCGAKTRLVDHLFLSAEVTLGLSYQWGRESTAYSSHETSTPPYASIYNSSENSKNKGWHVALSSIRAGFIIEL